MIVDPFFLLIIDYIGTFAFAISGAVAAQQKKLDIFGIMVCGFTTACAGGVIRDVCIGALPPVGMSDWSYMLLSVIAVLFTLMAFQWVKKFDYPVLFFDAIGLAFFASFGAHKTLMYTGNIEMAILLGTISAVGGGAVRDILLNQVPFILHKEIYATAAMLGAGLQVGGELLGLPLSLTSIIAAGACFTIRMVSIHRNWRLPSFAASKNNDSEQ